MTNPESQDPKPEPDFIDLVDTLAVQAIIACGGGPEGEGAPGDVDLAIARFHIGALKVLGKKTEGNLEAIEQRVLEEALHRARLAFIEATARVAEGS